MASQLQNVQVSYRQKSRGSNPSYLRTRRLSVPAAEIRNRSKLLQLLSEKSVKQFSEELHEQDDECEHEQNESNHGDDLEMNLEAFGENESKKSIESGTNECDDNNNETFDNNGSDEDDDVIDEAEDLEFRKMMQNSFKRKSLNCSMESQDKSDNNNHISTDSSIEVRLRKRDLIENEKIDSVRYDGLRDQNLPKSDQKNDNEVISSRDIIFKDIAESIFLKLILCIGLILNSARFLM